MKDFWARAHDWLFPTHRNQYHPHVLAERGLLVIFALMLTAEAFLVSNTISADSGAPSLASVGATAPRALPMLGTASNFWFIHITAPLWRVSALPGTGRTSFLALVGLLALLAGTLALMLSVRRRRYVHTGYVPGGLMLAFGIVLILANEQVLLPKLVAMRPVLSSMATYTSAAAGAFGAASSTDSTVPATGTPALPVRY